MRPALALAFACAALAETPEWLRQAAAQKHPAYPAKVGSVVLLKEEELTVDTEGRRRMRERGAVRILQKGSGGNAMRPYNSKTGRVREFRGWLLSGDDEREFGKNDIVDVALATNETYDESRAKLLECPKDAPEGAVFGWEIAAEETTVFAQEWHNFQDEQPVLRSRFVLSVPVGWAARGKLFNHGAVAPEVAGGRYTWELSDLPPIEDEDYRPGGRSLAPILGVDYYPSSGPQGFNDWAAVSVWQSPLVEPPAEVTPAIAAKAQELARGAASELDRIRAIAAFVQRTNYVAISVNLTKGGGYTPRPAADTLVRNYGDCKDKTTLRRALLKALGIESHYVAIYSGDRRTVQPEWPSPFQFNHAIIGIRVSQEVALPAVLEHSSLGRLLLFDPTDEFTPLGGLPVTEQGSYALVIAGDKGALVTAPRLPAAADRIECSVEARLAVDGSAEAMLKRRYFGQSASSMRAFSKSRTEEELKRSLERQLQARMGGITLKSASVEDGADGLDLGLTFSAVNVGQLMQERLLVLKPGLLAWQIGLTFGPRERRHPVEFDARLRQDTIALTLPAGFIVDEVPDPVDVSSPYGSYRAAWKQTAGKLVLERMLELKDTCAPASEYPKIRDFFATVGGSDQAAVVLLRR